jgi:hypothetical protein
MDTEAIDLNHIILKELPVCPICGEFITITDECCIAIYENVLFLIHYECGDVEFFDA